MGERLMTAEERKELDVLIAKRIARGRGFGMTNADGCIRGYVNEQWKKRNPNVKIAYWCCGQLC